MRRLVPTAVVRVDVGRQPCGRNGDGDQPVLLIPSIGRQLASRVLKNEVAVAVVTRCRRCAGRRNRQQELVCRVIDVRRDARAVVLLNPVAHAVVEVGRAVRIAAGPDLARQLLRRIVGKGRHIVEFGDDGLVVDRVVGRRVRRQCRSGVRVGPDCFQRIGKADHHAAGHGHTVPHERRDRVVLVAGAGDCGADAAGGDDLRDAVRRRISPGGQAAVRIDHADSLLRPAVRISQGFAGRIDHGLSRPVPVVAVAGDAGHILDRRLLTPPGRTYRSRGSRSGIA